MLFNYLRLVRFPYLFTALADVWAGYFIARIYSQPSFSIANSATALTATLGVDFILIGIISVCLYAAGMVFNDFVDVDKDAQFYPVRPLVTGAIYPAQAFWLGTLLCLTAVFLAGIFFSPLTLTITGAITMLMIAYNFYTKSSAPVGSLNMGLLRGFNQLLGMTVWGEALVGFGSNLMLWPLIPLAYIFFMTLLSAGEETGFRKGVLGLLIFLIILSIAWPLLILPDTFKAIWLILIMVVFWLSRLSGRRKRTVQIGGVIRTGVFMIIPLEASLVLGYGGAIEGLIILALIIPAVLFNKLITR